MQNAYDVLSAAAQLLQQLSGWKEKEPSTLERAILSSSHCMSIVCHDKLSKFRLETKAEHLAFVLLKCKGFLLGFFWWLVVGFFPKCPFPFNAQKLPLLTKVSLLCPMEQRKRPVLLGAKLFRVLQTRELASKIVQSLAHQTNLPPLKRSLGINRLKVISFCIRKFGFVGSARIRFPSEQHLQQHRSAHQMFDVIWGRMTSTGALQPARAGYTHSVGLGSDSFAISVILNRTEKLLNQLSHN